MPYNTLVQFLNLLDQHTAVIHLFLTGRKVAYCLALTVVHIHLDFLSVQQRQQDKA